ncbi:MAG: transglycosylase SLT domain-containing protein [Prevotella sp.]|nr:transglycosylase SLT domain-containing protein [Prevotella sp.]
MFLPCSITAQVVIEEENEDETEIVETDEEGDEEDADLIDEEEEVDEEGVDEEGVDEGTEEGVDDETVVVTEEEIITEDGKELDVPEALSIEADSLLDLFHAQHYLTPDSSCNMPDINPIYEEDVFIERLSKLPTSIEMPYNEVVRKFIDRYSGQLRRSVGIMLGMQNFYMPIFEQALETYGLPLELKYLPVIESALKPNAVSRVGATGLWQFMITTGKQYGLEVNTLVDERRDPVKASYAAARYLRDLYKIFHDWHLVIAAYNCGPENINKAFHRAGGTKDYWEIYPYLPAETRGYVPAFIAANYIMNYYCDHNICPLLTDLPAKTDTVVISRDVHFDQIAGVIGIDVKQLEELNPQYRRQIVNGNNKPSAIRLPMNYVGPFLDNEDSIYAYHADELLTKRLTVAVKEASAPTTVKRKTTTYRKSKGRKSRYKKSRTRRTRSRSVTVRKGDTLSSIAKRNGTTVSALKRKNGLKGNNIRAGKKLKVR